MEERMDSSVEPSPKRLKSDENECLDGLESCCSVQIEETPISVGAEAVITRCFYLGKKCVYKQRVHKAYRHPELDKKLIKDRMKSEIRGIDKCKKIGIACPAIYFINDLKNEVVFEEIQGKSLRDHLLMKERELSSENYQKHFNEIAVNLGKLLAKMHKGGLIHGDLTSANVLLRNGSIEDLVLIDFGLSYNKEIAEDKAVDLYVFERALSALHDGLDETTFEALKNGYEAFDLEHAKVVYKKLEEVRLRGRKRDMIG
uniref:Non-specific serine/threonine protein kinase n=2 Tax=Panagrolaimus sp. JU765 TaxID=591449 RepID=A0AC34QXN1_9BILA